MDAPDVNISSLSAVRAADVGRKARAALAQKFTAIMFDVPEEIRRLIVVAAMVDEAKTRKHLVARTLKGFLRHFRKAIQRWAMTRSITLNRMATDAFFFQVNTLALEVAIDTTSPDLDWIENDEPDFLLLNPEGWKGRYHDKIQLPPRAVRQQAVHLQINFFINFKDWTDHEMEGAGPDVIFLRLWEIEEQLRTIPKLFPKLRSLRCDLKGDWIDQTEKLHPSHHAWWDRYQDNTRALLVSALAGVVQVMSALPIKGKSIYMDTVHHDEYEETRYVQVEGCNAEYVAEEMLNDTKFCKVFELTPFMKDDITPTGRWYRTVVDESRRVRLLEFWEDYDRGIHPRQSGEVWLRSTRR